MKSVFYPLRLMALRLFLAAAVFGCAAAIERKPPSQAPSLQEIEEYAEFVLEGGEFSEEIFSMLAEKYFLEYAAMEKDEKGGEPPGHARFISTVKKLSGKHPVDKLSYAAGYALFESGMTSEATTEFESFLRDYPRSPYRSEVAFRLGEIYFDREKDKEAIERYALVLSEPGSQFFGGALYKTGWAWHRLDEFRKAFGYFVRLSDSAGEAVRKEAVANIVMTLGRMEGKERNSALSEIKDRDYAPHAALTLGALLNDQTRPEEALDAYSVFAEFFPDDALLPFVYEGKARSYELLGKLPQAIALRKELIERFAAEGIWYKKKFPEGETAVKALVAGTLLHLAKYYHGEAKKDARYLKKAIDSYKRYLADFSEGSEAKEAATLLGEAMFEAKTYEEAAEGYAIAVRLSKGAPEGEDAAFSALLSHELSITRGAVRAEEAVASIKKLEASYEEAFKTSGRRREFFYRLCDIYSSLGRYPEARGAIKAVEAEDPFRAMEKTAEIHVMEKNYEAALASYSGVLAMRDEPRVREKLANLHYMVADARAKEGKKKEAVEHYFKVFSTMRESPVAEDSLASIARLYLGADDTAGFATVTELLQRNYPQSKALVAVLFEGGKTLEEKGDYGEASRAFSKALDAAASKSTREKLVFKTAETLDKAGEYKRAAELLSTRLSSGDITEERKREALFRIAVVKMKSGEKEGAAEILSAVARQKKDDQWAARAAFALSSIKLEDYLEMKITVPFEKSLEEKTSLMMEILKGLAAAVKGRVEEVLAESFYTMGVVYENFSTALVSSERPADLTADEMKEYRYLLEEKAYPFEEEAVKAYRSALRAAIESESSAEFVRKSIERLGSLRPALYKREAPLSFEVLFVEPTPIERAGEGEAMALFRAGYEKISTSPQEAIKAFSLSLSGDPTLAEARYNIGVIFYNLKDYKKAKEEFLAAVKGGLHRGYFALGSVYMAENRIEDAKNALRHATALIREPAVFVNLGNIYRLEDRPDIAAEYYKKAEELDRADAYLNYNLALLVLEREEKGALERIERSLSVGKRAALLYAMALEREGDIKKALAAYEAAAGENPALRKNIGIIYEIYLGDYKKAAENYKMYLKENEDEEVGRWLSLVER